MKPTTNGEAAGAPSGVLKSSRKAARANKRINWDSHVVRIFKSVAGDQCILKKGSLKVLSSMLDDMIMRLGTEAATLCKIKNQMTMQPSAVSRAISLVCRRSELGQIMSNDAHKMLLKFGKTATESAI